MGASSAEIDQAIKDTRAELDQSLRVLERRAARVARVYGRVAAGLAIGVAAVLVGVAVYRRRRQDQDNVASHLHRVVVESIGSLPDHIRSKLKENLPIKVVIGQRTDETSAGNAWSGIAAKVAPTLIRTATTAVLMRLRGTPDEAVAAE